jgi:hypothetical protein
MPNLRNGYLFEICFSHLIPLELNDKYAKDAFKNAFTIHQEWNWDKQILKAVERLKEIQNSRI